MTWYKTGTVAVTPGRNAVIGTGTSFIANSRVGDAFRGPDGEWYEVTNIASDTALSIAPDYQGAAVAAGAYSLAPMQGYVKDSADALRAATQVIASGVADMQEQVAAATEAAESAGQSKVVASEQAGIATSAAQASTENKDAAQQAAQQSGTSAQASGESAVRAETARDSIIQSEQAAAASAAAAEDSADRAEEVTLGKAASGANNDITSLRAITSEGFDLLRQGIAPMVGATANTAGKKGLVPAGAAGDQDKFLTAGGVYKEAGGAGLPVGSIVPWPVSRSTLPAGWIARDGQLLNRADWPDLWALVSATAVTDAAWLTTPYDQRGKYSSGNGTTTFRVPDTNAKHADGNTIAAMFLRGDGKNSAGTAGLHQADQMQGFRFGSSEASWLVDNTGYAGGVSNSADFRGAYQGTGVGASAANTPLKPFSDKTNGVPRVGAETRPASESVIWCTVGAGKATNPGSVDVTALATSVSGHSSQITALEGKAVKRWRSGNLSLAKTVATFPHGLGLEPDLITAYFTTSVAIGAIPVGTVYRRCMGFSDWAGASGSIGMELYDSNASTFKAVIALNDMIITNPTGASTFLTMAQCTVQVELLAWK